MSNKVKGPAYFIAYGPGLQHGKVRPGIFKALPHEFVETFSDRLLYVKRLKVVQACPGYAWAKALEAQGG